MDEQPIPPRQEEATGGAPRTVGSRYQLQREIGRGGMSVVWLALDTTLGKQWAVKEIRLSSDPAERRVVEASLVAEANLIKRLDHAAIPRIVDLVDEGGELYVVMDYVDGRTLESVMGMGPQDEDDVVAWAVQLCDVLDYLHQQSPPVIYCDMKPSNVMLRPDGTVRLIDFGIAREQGTVHGGEEGGHRHLGTHGYAAPEQRAGAPLDGRADVYGLGATMYALLTGRRPPDDPADAAPLRQVVPELSHGIESIVARAMAANPNDRYSGAAEFAYVLENYTTHDEAQQRGLRRKWRAFTGALIGAAACLVVGLVLIAVRWNLLNSDFDYWMGLGDQSVDQETASAAYVHAAGILPADLRPYRGLFRLYRSDGVFSTAEEQQFEQTIAPNMDALRSDGQAWAELSFETGKLYWYYYGDAGYGTSAGSSYPRMRAASRWMHSAAEVEGFYGAPMAEAYADMADFACDVVPRMGEGDDAGAYAPYFARLQTLLDEMADSDNNVMRLDAAALAQDALRTYARKFRADGISQEDMLALEASAQGIADGVSTTTDQQDEELRRLRANVDATRQAIEDAFVDVGEEDSQ